MRAALITGASGALGAALCSAFRAEGYRVVGTDRAQAPAGVDAFVRADLVTACAQASELEQLAERLKEALAGSELGVLVHCAGLQILAAMGAVQLDDWQQTLAVNLTAPLFLTQTLLPELERAHGVVVNIGSVHARATKPAFIAYATSKAALEGLTRAMAVDLGPRVRVVAVHPAAIDTPMLRAGFVGREERLAGLAAMHPLGRIAAAGEIARFVVLLSGAGAGFATGAAFVLDGGVLSRLHDPE